MSVDVGTESTRAAVFDRDGRIVGKGSALHATTHPQAGWAEQDASDWWSGMGIAVRQALADAKCDRSAVGALCLATTSCTVVACKRDGTPLRPALLWMDARSAEQAAKIAAAGAGDTALAVNGDVDLAVKSGGDATGGRGSNTDSGHRQSTGDAPVATLSAEWMLPKALWLKEREPALFEEAELICECQDWLNFKCTGRYVANACNMATRWHCNGEAACAHTARVAVGDESASATDDGRPHSLLKRIGLTELADKWPRETLAMGACVGVLDAAAAEHLGLHEGVRLIQGGADAFVGLVGLGGLEGGVGLVTGSSHLQLGVVPATDAHPAPGVWGPYVGAPLLGLAMVEGGQSSTGAALQWARRLFSTNDQRPLSLRDLDEEAASISIGSDGITALETFQGARTPVTDPAARGALTGLTLRHTRAHVWRALLESICLGTRAAVEALAAATGEAPRALLMAGGATRSALWLQMHADATGIPVMVGECPDAPLLGGAILAMSHLSSDPNGDSITTHAPPNLEIIRSVTREMVRPALRVEPRPSAAAAYDRLYRQRYVHIAPALRRLRQMAYASGNSELQPETQDEAEIAISDARLPSGREALVVPSLLAADAGALSAAAKDAQAAGATWLHIDVADGSAVAGHAISSLGPAAIAAVHASSPGLVLDVHMAVTNPREHIREIATSGASRITFQFEATANVEDAIELAREIRATGCAAGVCIAPRTLVSAIADLIATDVIDLVDVLAVQPGRGGQPFDQNALQKLSTIRERFPTLPFLMIDGGINGDTAPAAARAGANVLVSGSYLFAKGRIKARVNELKRLLHENGH